MAYVCMLARNRRLSYESPAIELEFEVGKTAIQAAVMREEFHRQLGIRKILISEQNTVIRLH